MSGSKLALGTIGALAAAALVARRSGSPARKAVTFDDVTWAEIKTRRVMPVVDPSGGRHKLHSFGLLEPPMGVGVRFVSAPKNDSFNDPIRDLWLTWAGNVLSLVAGTRMVDGYREETNLVFDLIDRIHCTSRWVGGVNAWFTANGGGGKMVVSAAPMAVTFIRHEVVHCIDNALGGGNADFLISDRGPVYASAQKGTPLFELVESVVPVVKKKVDKEVERRVAEYTARLAAKTGLSAARLLAGEHTVEDCLVGAGVARRDAVKLEKEGFVRTFSVSVSRDLATRALGRPVTEDEIDLMKLMVPAMRTGVPLSWYNLSERERAHRMRALYPTEIGANLRRYLMGRHEIAARLIDQVAALAFEGENGDLPPGLYPNMVALPKAKARSLILPVCEALDYKLWRGKL